MAGNPISITYAATDNWAQHLAVAMTSVAVNNPGESFVFHVLHHDMTPATICRLSRMESARQNVKIEFHQIDKSRFSAFPTPKCLSEIPLIAYFRLALQEILHDEARTIYSDIDVLTVRGGLRELWETDLKGHPVACVSDHHIDTADFRFFRKMLGIRPEWDYFCSGLVVMDLEALRREHFLEQCLKAADRLRDFIVYVDQDVLNSVYAGRILTLPDKWNCTDKWNPFRRDVVQWHFQSQTAKPWCCIWKNITWMPYLKYLLKTPYRANSLKFVLSHLVGFFWFAYTKNCVRRYVFCGIRVWKRKV